MRMCVNVQGLLTLFNTHTHQQSSRRAPTNCCNLLGLYLTSIDGRTFSPNPGNNSRKKREIRLVFIILKTVVIFLFFRLARSDQRESDCENLIGGRRGVSSRFLLPRFALLGDWGIYSRNLLFSVPLHHVICC